MISFPSPVGSVALVSKVGLAAFAVAASLLSASTALSQGYSDNFDSYTDGGSLSGQGGWNTNDVPKASTAEYVGQSDFVGRIGGYTPGYNATTGVGGTDFYAYLGGGQHGTTANYVLPGVQTSYLYHQLSVASASTYAFNVDMSIATSTAYPNRDSFAWTFLSSANNATIGSSLFSLNFVPATTAGHMDITYSVNGGAPVQTTQAIFNDSVYHLTISVNVTAKTASVTMTPTGGSAFLIANVNLSSINPALVQEVAATWAIANGGTDANGGFINAGGNELLFNNYAVTVPEPSTWAMLGVGVLVLAVYARRRVQV